MSSKQKYIGNLQDHDFISKMIIVGDAGVGKTCLLKRYTENTFGAEEILTTLNIEFMVKTVQIDDKVVKLRMWDTAGQERFRTLTSSYYRGSHGIIIAFDLTDMKSFQNVRSWLNEIGQNSGENVSKLLVGNKSDLKDKRTVSNEIAKKFAEECGIPYLETSAKAATNVEEAFMTLAAEIKKGFDSGVFKNDSPSAKSIESRRLNEESWSFGNICSC